MTLPIDILTYTNPIHAQRTAFLMFHPIVLIKITPLFYNPSLFISCDLCALDFMRFHDFNGNSKCNVCSLHMIWSKNNICSRSVSYIKFYRHKIELKSVKVAICKPQNVEYKAIERAKWPISRTKILTIFHPVFIYCIIY